MFFDAPPDAPPAIIELLSARDGASGDELGRSVTLDGPFIAAGRWLANIGGNSNAGAARIWRRLADGTTVSEGEVVAPDGAADDEFGISVGLTASCDLGRVEVPEEWPRLVVGAWTANLPNKADAGAAYVYRRHPDGSWQFEAKLTASDSATDSEFGRSVSIADDLIVVGAWQHQISRGALYVFRREGTIWVQEAKLLASDGTTGDGLGVSVAIDIDESEAGAARIIAGAWGDDVGAASNHGAAYVFRRTGPGTWVQESKLIPAGGASGDEIGRGVALDGATAVVGSWPFFLDGPGAAYVFVRTGTAWSEQAKLEHPAPAASDYFGFSVGVAGDTALVGAWADDVEGTTNQGSVHLFQRTGSAWSHAAEITREDGAGSDYFGFSVAIGDTLAAVGSRLDDIGANTNQGSVALICLAPDACEPCPDSGLDADLDGDGVVDGSDLGLLLSNWGLSGLGDFDGNGSVDGADLGVLLKSWSE